MNAGNLKFNLPKNVQMILGTIRKAGHEAYIVGGCVRDHILGVNPSDYDITTSATPKEVKRLFPRTVDTGIKHGTVTVLIGKEPYEVTTFRIDGKYLDNRRPEEVTYTKSIQEDLLRRDFTINAMAYYDKIIDLYGGMDDLEKGIIRAVGNPDERFEEDALRMIRAIRFSARFDYKIEDNTKKAIVKHSATIKNISAERIHVELVKILMSDNPNHFLYLNDLKLLEHILPELLKSFETTSYNGFDSVMSYLLSSIRSAPKKAYHRWAILFSEVGDLGTVKKILKRLRFDNDSSKKIVTFLTYKDKNLSIEPEDVRRYMSELGDLFPEFIALKKTLMKTAFKETCDLVKIENIYNETIKNGYATSIKELEVGGNDLKALGFVGREIGKTLEEILRVVLKEPEKNNKQYLLRYIKGKMDD